MARSLKPIPLTKITLLHTRKGIKVLMTFLKSTNVATRQWILTGANEDVANQIWHREGVGWGRLTD